MSSAAQVRRAESSSAREQGGISGQAGHTRSSSKECRKEEKEGLAVRFPPTMRLTSDALSKLNDSAIAIYTRERERQASTLRREDKED